MKIFTKIKDPKAPYLMTTVVDNRMWKGVWKCAAVFQLMPFSSDRALCLEIQQHVLYGSGKVKDMKVVIGWWGMRETSVRLVGTGKCWSRIVSGDIEIPITTFIALLQTELEEGEEHYINAEGTEKILINEHGVNF